MRTKRQILASRLNGAKSKGPISMEGKQNSARNAEKHGFNSQYIVLSCEEPGAWQRHLERYFEEWQPETQTECDLVNDIAVCRWRLSRLIAMETAAMDLAVDRSRESIEKEITNIDAIGRLAVAYQNLSDETRVMQNYTRHESRFRRTIDRATEQLEKIRRERREREAPEPETAAEMASAPERSLQTEALTTRPDTAQTGNSEKEQNKPGNPQVQRNPQYSGDRVIYLVPPAFIAPESQAKSDPESGLEQRPDLFRK